MNNPMKAQNLKVIFRLQGGQRFRQRYVGMTMVELLRTVCQEVSREDIISIGIRAKVPRIGTIDRNHIQSSFIFCKSCSSFLS